MARERQQLTCKRCGKRFECRADDIQSCHCGTVPLMPATVNFLRRTTWGCLCVPCLKEIDIAVASAQGKRLPEPDQLVKGVHYYQENGLLVFTEYYHLLRGYCCKRRCRHCPYGFNK